MTTRRMVAGGVTALAMALLLGCGDRGEPPAPVAGGGMKAGPAIVRTAQVPPAVRSRLRTDAAAMRVIPEFVTAPGEVALDLKQVAKVTSRIDGQVEQVHVRLGDRVRTGQPLAAIGGLRLDELVQEYLIAKAQADVAENSFQRTKKLWAEQVVPERRLIEERGRHLETKARFEHIREKLLSMGMTAEELRGLEQGSHQEGHRYTVKAPIAGTVTTQQVVLGQGVSAGSELFDVVDTSRVWVFANLAIEQARRFAEGNRGLIAPRGGEPISATLTYIAPVADEKTRTVRVRFDVPNPTGRLKPQEYVDVRLAVDSPPTLAIPESAVIMIDQARGVFVEVEAGYRFTPLTIGRHGEGWVEVLKGAGAGDRVVTDGVFDLKNALLRETIQSGSGG